MRHQELEHIRANVAFIHPKSTASILYELQKDRIRGGRTMTDIYEKINELYDRRREVELGGGDERIEKQHEKGN